MNGRNQIRPIIAALRRHKAAVCLLIIEMALTMAVLGNVIFVVHASIQRSQMRTGADEANIGWMQSIGVVGEDNPGTVGSNIALLRQVAGVTDAAFGAPPLMNDEREPVYLDPARQTAVAHFYKFLASEGFARTLGLQVLQGREPSPLELPDPLKIDGNTLFPVVISQSLASRLWPGQNPLQRDFYDGSMHMRVAAVVAHLRAVITGRDDDDDAVIVEFAAGSGDMGGIFTIRTQPGQLDATLRRAVAAMEKANPGHVLSQYQALPALRADYFLPDRSLNRMLLTIMAILVVITTLGVGGLASFWVQQRRRQIGIRRALGASRGAILYYFHVENFLIVAAGVVLGVLFTLLLNRFLMLRFELPPLPAMYFGAGAMALWLIGQLAVFGPARRAAAVPPNEALR